MDFSLNNDDEFHHELKKRVDDLRKAQHQKNNYLKKKKKEKSNLDSTKELNLNLDKDQVSDRVYNSRNDDDMNIMRGKFKDMLDRINNIHK